jgi:flagellar motor switch protein FliN/FliY
MTERRPPNQDPAATVTVAPVELSPLEGGTPQAPSPESQDMNLKMILDIPVDIHVELGHTQISIRDILKLGSGAIIELDRLAGSPADIIVNGKLIGQGDVVVVNENFGIRITKLVTPEERIDLL